MRKQDTTSKRHINNNQRKLMKNTVFQIMELYNSDYKISTFNICKEIKEGIEI